MKSKHTAYHELLEALQRSGCALCFLGARAANRFLDALLYEYVNDYSIRDTLQASHGFCGTHSAALVQLHDALGTSILYNSLLGRLQPQLENLTPSPQLGMLGKLRQQLVGDAIREGPLQPRTPCPACSQRDGAAVRALEIIGEHGEDPQLAAALQESDGVCLPHLRLALGHLQGAAWEQLLERQQAVWQALRAELDEAIRKHDARFRGEAWGAEEDAWRRAVELTAGMPGVF